MPNTIALAKNYTSLLDEVYQGASVTADFLNDTLKMVYRSTQCCGKLKKE